MAVDIALDNTGDLAYSAGRAAVVDGAEMTRQRIELGLQVQRGEWAPDLDFGVDWLGHFRQKGRRAAMLADLRSFIQGRPGVVRLSAISAETDIDDPRHVAVAFSALVDDGVAQGEVTV